MQKSPKVIVKRADYSYENLRPVIFDMMDELGGQRIKNCRYVLLKPNLLTAARPEHAVVTHFNLVKAVAEYVLSKGAVPRLADSPPLGSFQRILKKSGIKHALKELPVDFKEFKESVAVDIGPPFGSIDLAKDALEAELIINLPKLKTHGQMLLTLGVKNMFGCVVGLRKPQWHLKTGVDRAMFARLLVQICAHLEPAITILDGILAMEGEGPGKGGTPRKLHILVAGTDAFALDIAVCRLLGLEPDRLPTVRAAQDLGLCRHQPFIVGELPPLQDFQFPVIAPVVMGPRLLHGFMRRHLLQRPACDQQLCQVCTKCRDICPARAITKDDGRISFAYQRCIRCYCCLEICPYGALHKVEPLAGRIVDRLLKCKDPKP